jgi:tRNA threonylcarbamoyladenosine biosynthesis protein TsaE
MLKWVMSLLKNLTETQVKDLAFDLALEFKGKDAVIGLSGDLGAGKTTFAKTFAQALGVKKLKSPTFIIVAQYQLKKQKLYHADFYRLTHLDQLQALGLADIFASGKRLILIEWVEKFPSIKKQCDLVIEFKIKGHNKRDVKITAKN